MHGATDINNDAVTFMYVWQVNGITVQTTTTSSTTDTLDLSQPGFGDKGDTITVTVMPSDATSSGAGVTASAVVAATPPTINSVVLDNYWNNFTGDDDLGDASNVVTA